jgi:hypothetical protein
VAAPLIVRLIMDAAGYLKTSDTAVASNTKLASSALRVGEAMQISSKQRVEASLRATEAMKAEVVGYQKLAASATESAAVRTRAALLAEKAEGRLNAQLGLSSAAQVAASRSVQTGERDLGKFTRGALAGSGAASSLGRSLAFASTGFIAVAGTSTLIASSIKASLDLAKTERQVGAQLKTTGKSWKDYGGEIDQADLKLSHISGFTNQELLQGFGYLVRVNGNVSESLKLTGEAADVARGRNISLASAAIALAKAQGGSVTALRRLGIVIPKGVEGLKALAFVQEKFAGQAAAGATVGDKFHASLVNTEEIIGNALLPTFTRLTTEIGDWLARMNESGRLQRDVNDIVSTAGVVFHTLADAIRIVDDVTGSFGNTLKFVLELGVAYWAAKGAVALEALAGKWGLVALSAETAAKAETAALGVGGLAVGAGVASTGAAAVTTRTARNLPSVFGEYASTGEIAAVGGAAAIATSKVASLRSALFGLAGKVFVTTLVIQQVLAHEGFIDRKTNAAARALGGTQPSSNSFTSQPGPISFIQHPIRSFFQSPGLIDAANKLYEAEYNAMQAAITQTLLHQAGGIPKAFQIPGLTLSRTGGSTFGPFGSAKPITVYTKYVETLDEQINVAQAALTNSTKDDVTAAKAIIARIKNQIDKGHLEGASLIQALQDEATQQGVLDNARQKAAAQAAKIAAAKLAAASSYTTPIDLQIAEVRTQLTKTTSDDIQVEKRILAAAEAALKSGKKNKQGQLAALQVILQAQQAIQGLTQQSDTTFTQPLKLQLALAKAQATGGDQTRILLQEKAALEKALKSSKGNIQKQIDIYNQISSINQQLGASATAGLSKFKQLNVKKLSDNLGLSPAARKALEARLSQIGPHGTVPGEGTGAYGFTIGRDGRPIHVHTHISIDGKKVADNTTKHQQRRRRRNSSQRRGPVAGGAG